MKKKMLCAILAVALLLAAVPAFAVSTSNSTDQSNMAKMAWLCHYSSYATVSKNNPKHTVLYAPSSSPKNEVKMAQDIMRNCETCGNITVDGIFGSNTRNAVKAVQKKNGASRDGVVGTNTWKYLCKETYVSLRTGGTNYSTVIFCPNPYYTTTQYARTIKYTISSAGLYWYYGTNNLTLD